ncbi:MAG: hypothetical protein V3U65_07745 [Granulosicoccaceae bacterium]
MCALQNGHSLNEGIPDADFSNLPDNDGDGIIDAADADTNGDGHISSGPQ